MLCRAVRTWVWLIAISFLVVGADVASSKDDSRVAKLEALRHVENETLSLPDVARVRAIVTRYADLFGGETVRTVVATMNVGDLVSVFEAANIAAFYSLDREHVEHMAMTFEELERRALTTERQVQAMYQALTSVRSFERAKELAGSYPSQVFRPLPKLSDGDSITDGSPSEWHISPHRRVLTRHTVAVPAQGVIVVAHPLCAPSRRAVEDIGKDPVLGPVLGAHARWMVPPARGVFLEYDDLQQWNRDRHGTPVTVFYSRDEWPMIDRWSTPTFYFFREGEVVGKIVGWPQGGRREELLVALRRTGLLRVE
jgi:hypothetical protein